jgi:hypothetical protein
VGARDRVEQDCGREGSKVFDLYQAGSLAQIRDYNLNDVRVTRKIYERMVGQLRKIDFHAHRKAKAQRQICLARALA